MSDNLESATVDYGPLQGLIGAWKGNKGLDLAPEPDGEEKNSYYETLTFEPVGDVTNAEQQQLMVVRYLQVVHRISDDQLIHNELGYWIWDASAQVVMHSLVIPRGVCVLAGGQAVTDDDGALTLNVSARVDDPDWGIIQSPFMREQARTLEFHHWIRLASDRLSYKEKTVVEIYGKTFDHTDENELVKEA